METQSPSPLQVEALPTRAGFNPYEAYIEADDSHDCTSHFVQRGCESSHSQRYPFLEPWRNELCQQRQGRQQRTRSSYSAQNCNKMDPSKISIFKTYDKPKGQGGSGSFATFMIIGRECLSGHAFSPSTDNLQRYAFSLACCSPPSHTITHFYGRLP